MTKVEGAKELSPADRLVKAFEDLAIPLVREHSDNRENILKNHKMQLRSAAVEAEDLRSTVVK